MISPRVYLILLLGFSFAACNSNESVKSVTEPKTEQVPAPAQNNKNTRPTTPMAPKWLHPLVDSYFHYSKNELVRQQVDTKGDTSEGWMIDNLVVTDTAHYLILHVGHDESEADESELRFVTDAWLYVDTLTRTIYDYDIAKETLKRWTR